jgi:hypothetical protein
MLPTFRAETKLSQWWFSPNAGSAFMLPTVWITLACPRARPRRLAGFQTSAVNQRTR